MKLDPDKLKDLELEYLKESMRHPDNAFIHFGMALAGRIIRDIRTKCLKED